MSAEVSTQTSGNPVTDHLGLWSSIYVKKATTGRGRNGKISPYGIQKLRELILELAVRGKLVPQDPNDEPASMLLEKNAEEKVRLIKKGKIKKQKKLADIGDDQPHFLPENWEWARLGDVTNYGITEKAEPGDVDDDTWILELEDVEKTTSKLLKRVRYSERPFRSSKNIFDVGDVLYGKLRPYLDKVLIADESGVCTTEIIPVRSYVGIVPSYLRLLLKAPNFIIYANESTHGMNLPRLGTDKARLALIPLAPTDEQHRIVVKVDELMALCDQLEQQQTDSLQSHQTLVETLLRTLVDTSDDVQAAQVEREAEIPGATTQSTQQAWNRIAEHFDTLFTTEDSIDQLKQTILQLAVMGKLVPQDPSDEPSSVLLKKIAEEKARLVKEKKIRKAKPVSELSNEERFSYLSEKWEEVRFAEFVIEVATGPFGSMVHKSDYISGGVELINPSHIIDGAIIPDSSISVSDEKAVELASHKLLVGDVVMARRGEMGRCAVVTHESAGLLCGTGSFVLRFYKDIDRSYVVLLFRSEYVRSYLGGESVGATMTNLNHGILNKMPIAVPPVEEQHRIVAKVEELMALCDALKARVQDAQTTQLHIADAVIEKVID